jgi:hypothetical protein
MIIETSDNRFFKVRESNDLALAHVWIGMPVKKVAKFKKARNVWVAVPCLNEMLVRKAASRVVEV